MIGLFAQPHAAGIGVVEEQGGLVGDGGLDLIHHVDIARGAHQVQRRDDGEQVCHAHQRALQRVVAIAQDEAVGQSPPHADGVQVGLGQAHLAKAHAFVGVQLEFLEHLDDCAYP